MSLFLQGIIQHDKAHTAQCLIIAEDGSESRYPINAKYLKKAIHGDTVLIKIPNGTHGFVQKIIQHSSAVLSGKLTIHPSGKFGYVKPWSKFYHKDFYVDLSSTPGMNDGDLVEIETVKWFKSSGNPLARILRKIYAINPHQEVIYTLNLPHKFPQPVLVEATLGNYIIEKDEQRIDLTHVHTFSFAHETHGTQTLYSLEHSPQGYRVGIHTIDAAYYIKAGLAIDREAYLRGTSYNLEVATVHMLPESLVYDKLSFLPGKERYAISFVLTLDVNLNVIEHYFFPSIIENKANISYSEAPTLLEDSTHALYPTMSMLSAISVKLVNSYHKGYPQIAEQVTWNKEKGAGVKAMSKTEESLSNLRLITNIIATRVIQRATNKMIYRTPRRITEQRVASLRIKLEALGCKWQEEYSSSVNIKRISKSDNRLVKELIRHNLLPSMYALSQLESGIELYAHVTSPVTRYADLVNQRILHAVLLNRPVHCGNLDVVVEHLQKVHKKELSANRYLQQRNMNDFSHKVKHHMNAIVLNVNKKGLLIKTDIALTGFVVTQSQGYQIGDTLTVKISERTQDGIIFEIIK